MKAVAVAAATAGLLAGGAVAAHATWGDRTSARSGPLTATVVPVPVASCGASEPGSQTFTWSPVAEATGYRLHHGPGGASVSDVPAAPAAWSTTDLVDGGTFRVSARRSYPSVEWVSAPSEPLAYAVSETGATCS